MRARRGSLSSWFAAPTFLRAIRVPRGGGRGEGIILALAGSDGQELARIAVERQSGGVAEVATGEADVGEFAAIHLPQRPQRRARGGDAKRPGCCSARA